MAVRTPWRVHLKYAQELWIWQQSVWSEGFPTKRDKSCADPASQQQCSGPMTPPCPICACCYSCLNFSQTGRPRNVAEAGTRVVRGPTPSIFEECSPLFNTTTLERRKRPVVMCLILTCHAKGFWTGGNIETEHLQSGDFQWRNLVSRALFVQSAPRGGVIILGHAITSRDAF